MPCRPTCIQPSPTQAHCGSCHRTLSGITAFDRHRRAGQCLSPLAIGLHADPRGIWRFPAPDPTVRTIWPQRAEPVAAEVWSSACAPGGYVCAVPDPDRPDGICGMPVESEPCAEHQARLASGETT